MFAKAIINYLEELAVILGPNKVTFHSQDDKAKVPLGITAAKKRSPVVIHMEYKVTLPDHDFVVAAGHKLLPSVIGEMVVKKKCFSGDAVTYSGAAYVAIRSGKHSCSTAYHHLQDMKGIRSVPEFESSFFIDGVVRQSKPVMIFTVDRGPDEKNPVMRRQSTVQLTIFARMI